MKTELELLHDALLLLDSADRESGNKITAHQWHARRRAFVADVRALNASSSRAKKCDLCGRSDCT